MADALREMVDANDAATAMPPPVLGAGASKALGLGSFSLGSDPSFQAGVKRLGELGGERQKAQGTFALESAGVQDKLQAERANADALVPPKMDAVDKPFQHNGLTPEQLTDATQTMFALAAIGGAMTRTPMTAALNSFAGAMKGLHKGDQDLFARESQEFDRNLKVAIAKNQQAMSEYKLAFDKHRGNMGDLMSEWNIIAKKHGDTVSAINMERQDIQGMLRQIEAMNKMDLQGKRIDQQISAQWALIRQKDLDRTERARQFDQKLTQTQSQFDERMVRADEKLDQTDRQLAQGERKLDAADKNADRNYELGKERNAIAREKILAATRRAENQGLKGKQLDSFIHNQSNIEAIDDIVNALGQNPDAVGFKTVIPGIVLNRVDAEGTPIRASIANVTSMTIKNRAGTAQTVGEMKNLAPFIPRDGDDYDTVVTKLMGMRREMLRENMTIQRFSGGGAPSAPGAAPKPPEGYTPIQ